MKSAIQQNTEMAKRDRLAKRIRRMTNEELIGLAIESIAAKEEIEKEFAMMVDALELRFPRVKATEEIITSRGVAERKESTSFKVPESAVTGLQAALGLEFADYIEVTPAYSVPEDRIAKLREHLGNNAAAFVKEVQQYKVKKLLSAKLDAVKDDGESSYRIVPKSPEHEALAAKVAPFVAAEKKITVKVKPVTV